MCYRAFCMFLWLMQFVITKCCAPVHFARGFSQEIFWGSDAYRSYVVVLNSLLTFMSVGLSMCVHKLKALSCIIISLLLCDVWHISFWVSSPETLCLINLFRLNYWYFIFIFVCLLYLFIYFKPTEIFFKCLYAAQFFIWFYQH